MLVVKRMVGERLVLSGGVEIIVSSVGRGSVKLSIAAPDNVWIVRGEVYDAAIRANAAAARTAAVAFASGAPSNPLETPQEAP
ncbi:MAG: carbon storage regulator [Polyangiaceae bacterium]